MTASIRLEELSKEYVEGDRIRTVLSSINETFSPGEFVAIRGRSGSGKTTLLNLIAGIDVPTSGTVYFDDLSIAHMTETARTLFRRDHLGFIFQFFNLIPTLTVLENVLLPVELTGWPQNEARRYAQVLLNQVDLLDRVSDYPDRLSGGEQQRVAIVRALIHRPDIILADEPTGNLDRSTGEIVMAQLNQLRREIGTTLLLVTHSRQVAARADRVLTIEDARLVPDRDPLTAEVGVE